jgi:hypothetical protein
LRVRDVIDGLCPVDDRSELTHGQVVEALVANRLTSPEPLVRVRDWPVGYAAEDVSGLRAEQLNDERVGRALDAIAPTARGGRRNSRSGGSYGGSTATRGCDRR